MKPGRSPLLLLVVFLLAAGGTRAGVGCPDPVLGDLAPGHFEGAPPSQQWIVTGDEHVGVSDLVVAIRIALAEAEVLRPGGCGTLVDPAPGLDDALTRTFGPIGDGAWTGCDAWAILRLALASRTETDASDFPGGAPAAVNALAALDQVPELSDSDFVEGLAATLETLEALPRGPASLKTWLELEVLGDCFDMAVPDTDPSSAATAAELFARIEATQGFQVLKEFLSTVVFAFVPEPIATTVQAANPDMFVTLSYVTVRANIDRAYNRGDIDTLEYIELRTILARNPYDAQRRLLEMTGQPIPGWLQATPRACMRVPCPAENCTNAFDDDGDGATDCADPDCVANPACIESNCANDIDDDGDGFTDCADLDCAGNPACIESNCANGVDDDGDGDVDCADSDCESGPACFESACANGLDDDGDGQTDCDDSDCFATSACAETDCGDGIDGDGDGAIDCDDVDCLSSPECQPPEEVWCGCYFDMPGDDPDDWWWRCHQQSSDNFSPPYDELVSPGECNCDPDLYVICE